MTPNCTCGCCGRPGTPPGTPSGPPPAGPAPRLRAGTHPTFLAAMVDRLASADLPGLAGLTTRAPDDPAIALCDAWAAVADVLTFYQERLGREGYLRTATEPRSVHELTRLIGYRPRPGVAAGTHLSFTLEAGHDEVIPAGTRVQSLPGPGELAQPYETSDPLPARAAANRLPIRTTRPQSVTERNAATLPELWLAGTATRLRANDLLLIRIETPEEPYIEPRRVRAVEEDPERQRTRVLLAGGPEPEPSPWQQVKGLKELVDLLAARPGGPVPPARFPGPESEDSRLRLAELLHPELAGVLHTAWAGATVTGPPAVEVYALRVAAPLFGHNAPRKPTHRDGRLLPMEQWLDWDQAEGGEQAVALALPETAQVIHLDGAYPEISSGTAAVLAVAADPDGDPDPEGGGDVPDRPVGAFVVLGGRSDAPLTVETVSRSAYGLAARTTRITLGGDERWPVPTTMAELRRITVHAAPEPLALAELPITEPVQGAVLELAGVVDGLQAGRLLVVAGERADLPGVAGVTAAELVRIAQVRHGTARRPDHRDTAAGAVPGERNHSYVRLERPLTHRYRRSTVAVHGNVVHATHGESRTEVLGSGDAALAHQRFPLRGGPLTRVSAPTPSGIESTLEVTVDEVRWPERPWFLGLGPDDRGYTTETDERGATTVVLPDGTAGRRPPTGTENIRARYRTGLGRAGNTAPGRITLLTAKPLGVREVVNPLPATGGTDPERPDQARINALLPLKTLDRLVSLSDHADFARAFAGVGKAAADRLTDGRGQLVVVTVTGADGTPLHPDSDVVTHLRAALRRFGDPAVRIRVLPAERLVVSLTARVRLLPDHRWTVVGPLLRARLLDVFGPVRRELAQRVAASEVVAVVQAVPGVHSCRGLRLAAVAPGRPFVPSGGHPGPWLPALGARRTADGTALEPAQHLCTAAELPELLDLQEDAA